MSSTALREIKASVEKLDLADQVRLLEYLTPRIASAVLASPGEAPNAEAEAAWRRYRATGQRLAATSVSAAGSLTDAVSDMRR
jgi:hypothetical protein